MKRPMEAVVKWRLKRLSRSTSRLILGKLHIFKICCCILIRGVYPLFVFLLAPFIHVFPFFLFFQFPELKCNPRISCSNVTEMVVTCTALTQLTFIITVVSAQLDQMEHSHGGIKKQGTSFDRGLTYFLSSCYS